jgi:ABC-type thiamin/hydroxymethylpyrimidine transport system permease subunit
MALLVLGLNLLHPNSVFPAGVAQVIFQLSIAAPVLWVSTQVRSKERLERILWLLFLTNAASAALGLAQVFYPNIFMPEISSLALSMNPEVVKSLTYVGATGQHILRPPGLTDVPGGAAIGGLTAALLGVVLGSQAGQSMIRRAFCFGMAAAGVSVIYFTQVRSLLVLLVVAIVVMCIVLARQGRVVQSAWIGSVCAVLLAVTFTLAVSIGGKSISNRFASLTESGLSQSFQQNRGMFLKHTFEDLLTEYPFGAGVGRWGMMSVYFAGDSSQSPPIWVEIQLTGWLLDGGVLMWLFYGGAILVSLLCLYRIGVTGADNRVSYLACIVLCLNCFVVGLSFAGPVFNTQLGIQFWFLTAAVFGVSKAAATTDSSLTREPQGS